ncbi:arrestin domain-containing protein 17 [Stomoxys calcitrans]|uniref:arrestin domain-containing protein 17 n=1 Tax=Stomoxys calcitrans TaxID=35570 RepID=UPI0027E3B06A|nr:arrestin domain-containing protein 17 [Stomoxys calcitrans]
MPSSCEFELNNPIAVYYSGETITGNVVLQTTSEKNIRSIRIRFLGEAKVSWQESERHKNSDGEYETRTVNFRGNEVYIDNSTMVRGAGKLPPGTYTFPFNITLPLSCPTSCEGKYGHIRYALWLIVERPHAFDNEFNRPLTVLRTADLNLDPEHKLPIQVEEMDSIGCWPCNSGNVSYIVRVPFGAYAPGQTLRYSLLIQNQSMSDISGYEVEFNENITFTAQLPRRKTRDTSSTLASQVHEDKCLRLSNREFHGELVLPSLPPDTEDDGIIDVSHTLEFELEVDGCHSNKSVSIPIYIGTVPITESLVAEQTATVPLGTRYGNITPSAPLLLDSDEESDKPPAYADFKPPSFEEAIRSQSPFKDPDANEHTPDIGFMPMYPVYPKPNESL